MSIFNVPSHEPDSGWEQTVVEAGSVTADALRPAVSQVVARVHPLEWSMGWMVSVPKNALGFFPAARSEGGVHGREVRTTWGPTHMVLYGGSFGLWSSWMDPESEELHMRADRRGNFALARSFSHFSIRSASAHLPDKPSGLGGSGLQACQLWDYDMSPVVTRLQMSVLLTSNGGREGRTVLPALRIHELREHTIFPPSLFSHPQVRKLCDLYAR